MPKTTENIAVNGNAGAFVNLTSTLWARKVEIEEDPNTGAGQGLDYQLLDENFLITHKLGVGEKRTLGDTVAQGNGKGMILGRPAQPDTGSLTGSSPATIYAKVRSSSAVATKARMTETE